MIERVIELLDGTEDFKLFGQLMADGSDATLKAAISAESLAGLIRSSHEMAETRRAGSHKIAIRTSVGLGGADSVHTIIDIINDDMPFLVDSTLAELQARGHAIHLILHPIFKVERSPDGLRQRILGRGDKNWGDGQQESHIVIAVEAMTDEAARALHHELDQVLTQVRSAVTDWRAIIRRVGECLRALEQHPPPVNPGIINETVEFCQWLIDGQFTFLGLREYKLRGDRDTGRLEPVPDNALGVLRDQSLEVLTKGGEPLQLTPEIRESMFSAHPLMITKSDITSRVHRRTQMDLVGLKTYDAEGRQTGELRVVGLFTSQAYTERPVKIPLLRQKVDAILRITGSTPGSHDGKAILNVIENLPRDELFRISTERLAQWALDIVDLDIRPRVRLFTRRDRFDRFVSALVYVPRDRFSTPIRVQIGDALCRGLSGRISSFTPYFPESPLIRIHYIIERHADAPPHDVDTAALEAEISDIAQMWDHRLEAGMEQAGPEIRLQKSKYVRAFSPAYAETYPVSRAIEDIERIERLDQRGEIAIDFYDLPEAPSDQLRAIVYRFDDPIPLSERVPVLENFGFKSIDEQSYRITPQFPDGKREVALHDMTLATLDGSPIQLEGVARRLEEAFTAVSQGHADNDPFNRLIVGVGASWREALMLRAYAAFMRQIRSPYGMKYVSDTLVRYPAITRSLIALFHLRFDPASTLGAELCLSEQQQLRETIEEALMAVPSIGEDQVLRTYLQLISATLRTNFYRDGSDSHAPGTVTFKLASRELALVPEPRPFREIWVYSPRVEGVHLRFGAIARGGIRWSDRAQDFRTEVLGLCKAQQVKNTVIVPEGAKGGFYPKSLPNEDSGRILPDIHIVVAGDHRQSG
jgi:glutamate dehydrogenase